MRKTTKVKEKKEILDKEYMSVRETAVYLGMSYIWTQKSIKAGNLPASKFGKDWRVSRTALDQFMQEQSLKNVRTE